MEHMAFAHGVVHGRKRGGRHHLGHHHGHYGLHCIPKGGIASPAKTPKSDLTPIPPRRYGSKKLGDLTLCLQVMDHDRFTRDDPIGEVLLPLRNVKVESGPVYWKRLQKPTIRKTILIHEALEEYQGEIMLSLCYLPQSSKLTCVVIKAKDLPQKDITGSSDPYVKLWLIHGGSKTEKRKTSVKSQSLNPTYNESFAFSLPPRAELEANVQLVVTVMDYDLLSSNDEMGHAVIGSRGGVTGAKHWKEVMNHPEHPCAMWHKLSPKW